MKVLKIAVGLIVGALAGAALGVGITAAITAWSKWTHPEDPSAGSVAILAIALVPGGFLFGAGVGATLAGRWSRPK